MLRQVFAPARKAGRKSKYHLPNRAPQRRSLFMESLEDRRLLTSTPFLDTFESGSINATNWPSAGPSGYVKAYVSQEGTTDGPINAAGSYAASFYGSGFESPVRRNVGLQSKTISLAGYTSASLSYLVQAGGNEDPPDADEDLTVQYRNSSGSWITLQTEDTNSVSHTSFTSRSFILPSAARQSNFAIRFLAAGLDTEFCTSGFISICLPATYDFWYLDDVKVVGNRSPTISTSGSGTGLDSANHTMSWTASDPDGDSLTMTAELWKNGAKLRSYSPTPVPVSGSFTVNKSDGPGSYTIKVTAKDTSNVTTSVTSSTLTVTDDDVAPPQITLGGSNGTQLTSQDQRFTWSISDASDSTSTVTITRNSPVLVSDEVANSAKPSGWNLTTNANGTRAYSRSYTTNIANEFFDFNALGVGSYTIAITATDKDTDRTGDQLTANTSRTVNVLSSPPVVVLGVATPTSGWLEGNAIIFDAGSSTDPDNGQLSFVWNFGDGTLGQGPAPAHVYADNGSYLVTLTAISTQGLTSTASLSLPVENVAPSLTAVAAESVLESASIELALAVHDPGRDTASYQVDWGDGNLSFFSSGGNKQHTYQQGDQQVTLRVGLLDEDGNYPDQFIKTIAVLDAPPVVSLAPFWTAQAGAPLDLHASARDGSQDELTYAWDFGDGATAIKGVDLASLSHAYAANGVYALAVTVSDSDGFSVTATSQVVIGSPVSFSTATRSVVENVGSLSITASLDQGIHLDHDVTIPLVIGGSVAASDYSLAVPTIVIPQGQLSASVALTINDDGLDENDEELIVSMGLVDGGSHGTTATERIVIEDNDARPAVFLVTPSSVTAETAQTVAITAALTEVSGRDVVVPLHFTGTATTGQDFLPPVPQQITIPAGALSASYSYELVDDLDVEGAESIIASLLPSTEASLSTAPGQPTVTSLLIAANDAPLVSFDSAYRLTAEGVPAIQIYARLSHFTDQTILVPFTISGSASNGLDYDIANTTLTFLPGSAEAIVYVEITDDVLAEGTEYFFIQMQAAANATLGTSQSVLTNILDNDLVRVSFDAGAVSRFEGTGNLPVVVRLSNPSATPTIIDIVKSGTASQGTDFSVSSWQLEIPAGSTTGTLNVNLLEDSLNESAESIFLTLGTLSGTSVVAGDYTSKSITVLDNDPLVSLTAGAVSFAEAHGSTQLTVQLSAPSNRAVTVPLSYSGTATRNQDYTAPSSVTVAAGNVSASFTVTFIDDSAVEATESVKIAIGTVTGGIVSSAKSVALSILDNDEAPTVYWSSRSYSVSEESAAVNITVGLTKPATANVTVNLDYVSQGAEFDFDFARGPASVTIGVGATSATFSVPLVNDELSEPTETFAISLRGAQHATLPVDPALRQATVRILDYDRDTVAEQFTESGKSTLPPWFPSLGDINAEYQRFKANSQGRVVDSIIFAADFASNYIPPPWNLVVKFSAWTLEWLREEYPLDGWINGGAVARDARTSDFWVRWGTEMVENMVSIDVGLPFEINIDSIDDGLRRIGDELGFDYDQEKDNAKKFVGKAFGGYAFGATLFLDVDFNGIRSPLEPFGATTADGLTIVTGIEIADVNQDAVLNVSEGQWVSEGGIDTSVGAAFQIPLVAPANFRMITPTSTLISKLLAIGAFERTAPGVRAATTRYLEAFGLPDRNLSEFDFMQSGAQGDLEAATLFGRETQMYDTVISIASFFDGLSTGLPFRVIADTVLTDVAAKLGSPETSLDLTRPEVIQNILQGVGVRLGAPLDPHVQDIATDAIARSNQLINELAVEGTETYLRAVVQVQSVTQGELSDRLRQLAGGQISHADFAGETALLDDKVAAAETFNVLPVYLGIGAVRGTEGTDGTRTLEFTVTPRGTSVLPISVDYQTGDGTALAGSDYGSSSGTLTWEVGDTRPKTVVVMVFGDDELEPDEYFSLFLANAYNATVLNPHVNGTILNDDSFSHMTPAFQADGLIVAVDGSSITVTENGVEVLVGRYENGATVDLNGDAADTLTVYASSAGEIVRTIDMEGMQTLVLDGHTIRVRGISPIVHEVLPDIDGLPTTIVAESSRIVAASVPLALDASALTYAWRLYEGNSEMPVFAGSGASFTFVPTIGEFRLELTMTDGNQSSTAVRSFEAIDPNVPPIIDSLTANSVAEHGIVHLTGTYHDDNAQDTHTITINWGEGDPQTVTVSGGTFSVPHQYLDDNPPGSPSDIYTISIVLTDDDTDTDSASTTTTITNVTPILAALSNSSPGCSGAGEGEAITISALFTDVGTLDTHSVIINWGDTTSSAGTVTESGGSGTVSGSHTFAAGGVYTITVTLTDDDTGTHTLTTTAVITGVGVVGSTLYVVGTEGADHVSINQTGNGTIKVHADFLANPDEARNISAAGVEQIFVILCGGDDHATIANRVTLPAIIDGGDGDDHLNAGGGGTVLLGGDGDDMLVGGSGNDIIIGGAGLDRLVGGAGEDFMAGGSSSYKSNSATQTLADDEALLAFLADWRSNDSRTDRELALDDLVNSLTADGDEDKLTGASADDWFWADQEDLITDLVSNGKGKK